MDAHARVLLSVLLAIELGLRHHFVTYISNLRKIGQVALVDDR